MGNYVVSGTAWVNNGWRLVFNARELRRGKDKGMLEVYYRRGSGYKKTIVREVRPI